MVGGPPFPFSSASLMPSNLTPALSDQQNTAVEPYAAAHAPVAYRGPDGPVGGEPGGLDVSRIVTALGRYKWLILALTLLGAVVGYVATRFLNPQYQVVATVYATPEGRTGRSGL